MSRFCSGDRRPERESRRGGLHITVESAGTVDPPFHCDLLSLSPKTANSDPSDRHRDRHRELRLDQKPTIRLLKRFPEHQIKYVVEGAEDMPEILEMLAALGHVEPARVLLMAQGRTVDEVTERAPAVSALCLEYGFRYTPAYIWTSSEVAGECEWVFSGSQDI